MALLALRLVDLLAQASRARQRPATAAAPRSFQRHLQNRRLIQAQHVNHAVRRIGRRRAPVRTTLIARHRHRVSSIAGGVNRPPCGRAIARLRDRGPSYRAISPASGATGLMSSTVNFCRANGGGLVGNGCVGHALSRPACRSSAPDAPQSATSARPSRDRTHRGTRSCRPAPRRRHGLPFAVTVIELAAPTTLS